MARPKAEDRPIDRASEREFKLRQARSLERIQKRARKRVATIVDTRTVEERRRARMQESLKQSSKSKKRKTR